MYALALRHTLPQNHTLNSEHLAFTALCIATIASGVEVLSSSKKKSHIMRSSRLRKKNSKLHQSKSRQPPVTVAATYTPPRHRGLSKSSTELVWQVHPWKGLQTQKTHTGALV